MMGIGGWVDNVTIMPGWGIRLWSGTTYTGSNCVVDNRGIPFIVTTPWDCQFWGYISGTTLTVTSIISGSLFYTSEIFNPLTREKGIVQTQIAVSNIYGQMIGGGTGTYQLDKSMYYFQGDGTKPAIFTYSQYGNGSHGWFSIKVFDASMNEYLTNVS